MEEPAAHHPTCRVCWEQEDEDWGLLISPCRCIARVHSSLLIDPTTGTQRWVHVKCLRRWQMNVQRHNPADERAFRCGVCRAKFSLAPPRPQWSARLLHTLRGLGGAACVLLLAFGLSGPPWPHLALLVLLLAGTRSHSLLAVALLLAGSLLAALHTRGLRVVMRVDGAGRLGLAVVRNGPPVEGLAPGTLLVASEELDRSIFRGSAILLTHHSLQRGARGVILTQPMTVPPALPGLLGDGASADANATDAAAAAAWRATRRRGGARGGGGGAGAAAHPLLQHFLGGPVGLPGEGVRQEMLLLHNVHGVPAAARLLPRAPPPEPAAAPAAAAGGRAPAREAAAATSGGGGARLYVGGSLADVLELAEAQLGGGGAPPSVLIFHGVCAWAEGQLEGEVRSGHWGFAPAALEDVLPPQPAGRLWQVLVGSERLVWMDGR
eukprot:scaffold2.g6914.t1